MKVYTNKIGILVVSFLLISCQSAPRRIKTVSAFPVARIQSAESLQEIAPDVMPEKIAFHLVDSETGQVLDSRNPDRLSMPASTMKLPTTIAALEILGFEHRFTTRVTYTGTISKSGDLIGDLYLIGGGDPKLSIPDLMNLADQLRGRGIDRVQGRFFYDESLFPSSPWIDSFQEADSTDNSALGALSLEFNRWVAQWIPEKNQESLGVYSIPPLKDYFRIGLAPPAQRLRPNQRFTPTSDVFGNHEDWGISDQIMEGGYERLPVKNAGAYAAGVFQYLCLNRGVQLPQPIQGKSPSNAVTVAVHRSQLLFEHADLLLENSNNVMAELVLLSAARKLTGRGVNLADAGVLLRNWWERRLQSKTNFRVMNGAEFKNGSGLSAESRITPRQLVEMLQFTKNKKYGDRAFFTLLPVSGWKGTLSKRMLQPDISLSVWAKTGTMNYTVGLAGYLFTRKGRKLTFAILINHPERRAALDSTETPSDEFLRESDLADEWIRQARSFQDLLLRNWAIK